MTDLFSAMGIDCEILPCKFRYAVYGKSGGLFEGVKIESFSPDKIIFSIGKGKLEVTGKKMKVKKYIEEEVALSGEILGVEIK